MAEKKLTRKELLKEPDEFISTTGQIVQFVHANPRLVTIVCVVVVVCVLGGFAIYSYRKHQQATGLQLFDRAVAEYHAAVNAPEPVSAEQLDKLLNQFESLARDYGSFAAGEMALLYAGHVLYMKGDFKRALGKYDQMQSTNLDKTGLGPLVLYHIAMTRMALKEYEEASSLFGQLSKDTDSPYRREAYGAIARIYEAMGKKKEAAQAYRQYLKMFPEAPDAAFIRARLAELSAQG